MRLAREIGVAMLFLGAAACSKSPTAASKGSSSAAGTHGSQATASNGGTASSGTSAPVSSSTNGGPGLTTSNTGSVNGQGTSGSNGSGTNQSVSGAGASGTTGSPTSGSPTSGSNGSGTNGSGATSSSTTTGTTGSGASNGVTGSTAAITGASSGTNGGANSGGSRGSTGPNGSSGCPGTFTSLTLSPATTTVTLDGGTPAPITFTVNGVSSSSSTPVNASLLTWTATRTDDAPPGSVSAGVYQPLSGIGGTVTISATGCGASGTATVNLDLNYIVPSTTDGGPTSASFTGPVADGGGKNAPIIVYPNDRTRFPRNVYKITFQWNKSGNTLFRLLFTGANSTVTIYTDGNDPSCAGINNAGCWQADLNTWNAIASSNAGSTVTFEVDGTPTSGGTVYTSATETLGFSRRDVAGAIFYWAANKGGVERATVSDSVPEDYIVGQSPTSVGTTLANGDVVQCAACHAVSRDGTRMAVSGQSNGKVMMGHGLWSLQVTPTPPPSLIQGTFAGAQGDGFSAWAPDDERLVWSPRNGGSLLVVDSQSGNTLSAMAMGGPGPGPGMGMGSATDPWGLAPDWRPRTDVDVVAYADQMGNIAQATYYPDAGTFGAISTAAPVAGGQKNNYPSYSPDSAWLAYTANNTLLYVVSPDGGTPLALNAANVDVNNTTWNPTENSMPTWAPPGDLYWVAFNSQRPYGLVTNGGSNQIWLSAVDFGVTRADGGDPSYPGFWLPFQDLTSLNHRAFWTLDVRVTQDAGAPDAGCVADGDGCSTGSTCCDSAASCVFLSSVQSTVCAVPVPDAGPPDAGSCINSGDVCNPTDQNCCGEFTQGTYCGEVEDGGYVCSPPVK